MFKCGIFDLADVALGYAVDTNPHDSLARRYLTLTQFAASPDDLLSKGEFEPTIEELLEIADRGGDVLDEGDERPGRLERLVFVPPPDAEARKAILQASGKSVPLAEDVDLDALADDLDGYSAADCAALLREAALTALRRSMDATDVTAEDVETARRTVRPSLDPEQVANLKAFSEGASRM